MDIGKMLVQFEQRLEAVERQSRLKSAALDDTTLVVRDDTGGLRAEIGKQGDGTTAVTIVNGPPPPAPSTPIAVSVLGGVTASWDGQFAGGQVMPLDWSRVEVHASTADGFTPGAATLQSTIETAQGATTVVPTDDPVYVVLVARTTSGTASTPSAQAGPYGPSPVVASGLLDGIVTELKLANDAVTAAKIATAAVGTTEIADNAVTTAKVIAGAILAGQIAAGAVITDKLAAEAVTAGKIAALAITTDKLDANAVTTAKLSAGSVDATSLKADAITGKTITGGIINGAEFHSDDGVGGLVDIQAGKIEATANNGWKILIDPTQTLPVIVFLDSEGDEAGAINATGDDTRPTLNISSGPFTDGLITDWRWANVMGSDGIINAWKVARVRESDTTITQGGFLYLDPTRARLSYTNSQTVGTDAYLQIQTGLCRIFASRLSLDPPASSSSAIFSNSAAGQTGPLLRLQLDGVDKLSVSTAGAVTAAGAVSAASMDATGAVTGASVTATGAVTGASLAISGTTFSTYTPTITGGGIATYTSRTGWYFKVGKMVFMNAEFIVNAAGDGTATITITAPSSIYRGSRQVLTCHAQSIYVSGLLANGAAHALDSGTGAVIDRISVSNNAATNRDNILNGGQLLAGARVTITGWYREA